MATSLPRTTGKVNTCSPQEGQYLNVLPGSGIADLPLWTAEGPVRAGEGCDLRARGRVLTARRAKPPERMTQRPPGMVALVAGNPSRAR
jgi:hypothetical protein